MIGTVIANYRVVDMLGEGGMGVVYKAVDVNLDRTVAMKILSPELSRDPGLIERFQSEAKAQASLNHTNIATLYNFMNVEGSWLIVMEFVDGETLEQAILRNGMLQADVAVPLFKQVLAGMGFAHRLGIVHRDIKPANIMVNRHGVVKVMDFGIAKALSGRRLTRTGVAVGTVAYMSPEQIRNQNVDMRSDIYSLGVTLYQMLTAHLPFDNESDFQIQYDHVNTPPPPLTQHYPYIPPAIEAAVLRSMEKDPANRFRTVEEFSAALDQSDVAFAAPPIGGGVRTPVPQTSRPSSPSTPAGAAYGTGAQAARTPAPAARSATILEQPVPQFTPPPPSPGLGPRKSPNLLLVGGGALVVVAALGFGIWKWTQGDKTSSSSQTQQSSQVTNNNPAPQQQQQPQQPPPQTVVKPPEQTTIAQTQPPAKEPEKKKQEALNIPPQKLPETKPGKTPPPQQPVVQQPDQGALALQKAQQLYMARQLLNPSNNSALYWAIQARNFGTAGGSEMEQQIQNSVHTQFQDWVRQKNYPMASNLINEIETYYRPGTFDAWRTELRDATTHVAATPPTTTTPTGNTNTVATNTQPSGPSGRAYRVQHRHVNKVSIFVKTTDPPEWYYNGTLTVSPDGSVTFRCVQATIPQHACEADIEIPVSDIHGVKASDMLHIQSSRGNFDFRADGNTMTAIRNEITTAMAKK